MTADDPSPPQSFETRAIHAGYVPDPQTGAIMPPIYASSTFAQDAPGEDRGYEYARTGNPTRDVLEATLTALESGTHGRAFASGMAAIDTVMTLLDPGDHVVVGEDVYGGTYRLFEEVYRDYDIHFSYVDATDPHTVEDAVTPATELVWIESPTNPLLHVVDIEAIATATHRVDALLGVDNTFATPYLQQPLERGADIVAHSLTKYLGGHSDVIGGALVTRDADLDERIGFYQNSIGATPDPFGCFLILRGIKTLPVRMDRHCQNAMALATWLRDHPRIKHVYYPGLSSHPQHDLATRQMTGYGGMVSFEVDGSAEFTREVAAQTEVFTLAESLGGVESLIEHPASMTHGAIPSPLREQLGVTDTLIRLSVGIEGVDDLRVDLKQALETAPK